MARPLKYNDSELIDILRRVRTEYTGKLTPYILEKKTGVSKAVWIKRFNEEIEELNNVTNPEITLSINTSDLGILSLVKIFEENKDNEAILRTQLISYDVLFQNLLKENHSFKENQDMLDLKLKEVEELKQTIYSLNEEVKESNERAKHFEKQYLKFAAESSYSPNYRTERMNNAIDDSKEENLIHIDFIARNKGLFEE